jgi:4-hydroxy-tetrahydrodipicolinate reductase
MTSIGILGSEGRMGRAIAQIAHDQGIAVAGGVDAGGDPLPLARRCDVLVDFTAPSALQANLAAACETGTPIVVGTTGLRQEHHDLLDNAAARIAVLQTGTTSLGIVLLAQFVTQAAARLGPECDIEIVEAHHRHKVDAPSGTALMLGEAAAEARGAPLGDLSVVDRSGLIGARAEGTIGFSAIRGGSIAGDHLVIFAGPGERIELGHRAESREMFARGAVRAALWLAGQPAGRYTMAEVLGL